jgi:hypothetical protein
MSAGLRTILYRGQLDAVHRASTANIEEIVIIRVEILETSLTLFTP